MSDTQKALTAADQRIVSDTIADVAYGSLQQMDRVRKKLVHLPILFVDHRLTSIEGATPYDDQQQALESSRADALAFAKANGNPPVRQANAIDWDAFYERMEAEEKRRKKADRHKRKIARARKLIAEEESPNAL